MVEEGAFEVTITLRTTIQFSPIERETPLVEQDAIENAYGTFIPDLREQAQNEGWEISAHATRER